MEPGLSQKNRRRHRSINLAEVQVAGGGDHCGNCQMDTPARPFSSFHAKINSSVFAQHTVLKRGYKNGVIKLHFYSLFF